MYNHSLQKYFKTYYQQTNVLQEINCCIIIEKYEYIIIIKKKQQESFFFNKILVIFNSSEQSHAVFNPSSICQLFSKFNIYSHLDTFVFVFLSRSAHYNAKKKVKLSKLKCFSKILIDISLYLNSVKCTKNAVKREKWPSKRQNMPVKRKNHLKLKFAN